MARIIPFVSRQRGLPNSLLPEPFATDFSIEVMPRSARKIEDFRSILPAQTRVYVAEIEGTPWPDMLHTASRLSTEGFAVVPHLRARAIANAVELEERISAYAEAGVCRALVIAGGVATPRGDFREADQLLRSGLFDRYGFREIFVAGHPEGNSDIDPSGGHHNAMDALRRKAAFQADTDMRMAITTQFGFEAGRIIGWAEQLAANGIHLPIHLGVAGPAKLQTLIKYAMACGVGPSLRVLHRRAADLSKLIKPFEPTDMLAEIAVHKQANPAFPVERVHFFPLGGIRATTEYAAGAGAHPIRAHA